MVKPDFKAMSEDELIDYTLEQGEGCGALEEYVRRIKNNPQIITFDPKTNPNWSEQFIKEIREKYAQSMK